MLDAHRLDQFTIAFVLARRYELVHGNTDIACSYRTPTFGLGQCGSTKQRSGIMTTLLPLRYRGTHALLPQLKRSVSIHPRS